jgi:DNA polymerase elongation subunit (family B)
VVFEKVKRKYCFEYKVDYRNEEVEVVKMSYSFKSRPLNSLPQEGTSYKGVFGLSYKPSELFFLQTGIRGTCWINLNKYEIKVDPAIRSPIIEIKDYLTDISRITKDQKPPTFNLQILQVIFDEDSRQINQIYLTQLTDYDLVSSNFRQQDQIVLKVQNNDTQVAEKQDSQFTLKVKSFQNESQVLNNFRQCFINSDPDILIGHEIITSCIEPIANKCKEKGIDVTFLGKFPQLKTYSKETMMSPHTIQQKIMAGRPSVDLKELAKG